MEKVVVFAIIALLIISTAAVAQNYLAEKPEQTEKCHVGVAFCGNTTAEAELLIDKTKDYTNLFVLQSGLISKNETAINISVITQLPPV